MLSRAAVGVLCIASGALWAQEWQQTVSYRIQAELIPAESLLIVRTQMHYRNNSPDTLRELFLHLYWNIFAANSYARELARQRRLERIPEMPPVRLDSLRVIYADGLTDSAVDIDNTIARVPLPRALPPGESLQVVTLLRQRVPPEGMRMGQFRGDFFIANWFPSVCVYDRYGWHTDQYLGTGEFYEEVADFEVELTLPGNYLVVHTGELLNPEEVLPASAWQQLQALRQDTAPRRIYNADAQPLQDTSRRTWRFRAQQARTVAFAAVRRYIWDAQRWGETVVHVLYPPQLESFYRDEGLRAAVHAVRFLSEHFGPYVYPNMFVVVGGTTGGMEYPGIVFIGRGLGGGIMAPVTASVIMHEIAHNWYPMMLNSNETEFAFQDEGFTTFVTTLAMEAFYGRHHRLLRLPGWLQWIVPSSDERTSNAVEALLWSLTGWDEPILTHSDRYRSPTAYTVNSYSKTASLLFMLRGIMGEAAFAELMRQYYWRYRFRHVYPEDFFALVSEVASRFAGRRVDLRYFFDQWFAKTVRMDFALAELHNRALWDGRWEVTVGVERRQEAIVPLDLELRLENGQRYRTRIEAEEFLRGPALVRRRIVLPARAVEAVLDPDTLLLLESNRLNNSSRMVPPWRVRPFVELLATDPPELYAYGIFWQPAVGFTNRDGLKLGVELRGAYLGVRHAVRLSLTQGLRLAPQSTNLELSWSHLLWELPVRPRLAVLLARQDGWWRFRTRMALQLTGPAQKFVLSLGTGLGVWYRESDAYAFAADALPDARKPIVVAARTSVGAEIPLLDTRVQVRGFLEPIWYAERDEAPPHRVFGRWVVEGILRAEVPVPVRLRGVLGWVGEAGQVRPVPRALLFRRATVTPLEAIEQPLYRAPGIISNAFRQQRSGPFGGAFLRGYLQQDSSGSALLAFNAEVSLAAVVRAIPLLNVVGGLLRPYIFADAGQLVAPEPGKGLEELFPLRRWRWDAGVGVELPLSVSIEGRRFGLPLLQRMGIGTVAVDLPLLLSHPVPGEKRWRFRWVLRLRTLEQAMPQW